MTVEPAEPLVGVRDKRFAPGPLFLVAAVFLAASPVFWLHTEVRHGEVAAGYENADLYERVYPTLHYGFERLRSGSMPLWNPRQFCGTPFQANPESALFQPLNLGFLVLPTQQAMALHAFLCLSLMGLFTALFTRSLGAGYVPSFVGGVCFAYCGASAAAASYPELASALAWMPLLFLGLHEYACKPGPRRAVLPGLAAGMVLLCGSAAMALTVLCAATAYGVYTVFLGRPKSATHLGRRFEGLLLMVLIALGISAVQWAPTLAWAFTLDKPVHALLAHRVPGELPHSLRELVAHALSPKPGTLPRVGYIGVLALPAIPAALFAGKARREALFFLALAVACLYWFADAAGRPALPFPHGLLVYPGVFGVSVLVALGLGRIYVPRPGVSARRVWLPALAVAAGVAGLFYLSTEEPRGRLVAFALLLLPAVIVRRAWMSVVSGVMLGLLLFTDLTTASINAYTHPFLDAHECYNRYASTVRSASEQALDGRVLCSSAPLDYALTPNLGLLVPGLDLTGGSGPLTKEQVAWWRRLGHAAEPGQTDSPVAQLDPAATAPALINFMAVQAIVAAPRSPMYAGSWQTPGPTLREMVSEDAAKLFINDAALPRAFWTPAWDAVEGVAAAADALAAPGFDGTLVCLVDRDSDGYAALAETVPGPAKEGDLPENAPIVDCAVEDVSPERVVVRVTPPAPGVIVLSDTLTPGWTAELDGTPAPLLRVNGLFRGVATPAGPHAIAFEYRPPSYRLGLAASLFTGALLVLSGLAALFRSPGRG